MDDQALQRIANIAQIVSVIWILLLGSKTIADLMKGTTNVALPHVKRDKLINISLLILIIILCTRFITNTSPQIRLTWYHLLTIALVTVCISYLCLSFLLGRFSSNPNGAILLRDDVSYTL